MGNESKIQTDRGVFEVGLDLGGNRHYFFSKEEFPGSKEMGDGQWRIKLKGPSNLYSIDIGEELIGPLPGGEEYSFGFLISRGGEVT